MRAKTMIFPRPLVSVLPFGHSFAVLCLLLALALVCARAYLVEQPYPAEIQLQRAQAQLGAALGWAILAAPPKTLLSRN